MTISRRDAIKLGVFGGAALALPFDRLVNAKSTTDARIASSKLPSFFSRSFRPIAPAVPALSKQDPYTGDWVDLYELRMRTANLDLLGNGLLTPMFTYNGQVPGPTIRAQRGRRVVVRHVNDLPATHPTLAYKPWSSVHLHGSGSLPQYDGYASDITQPSAYKRYRYPNHQPARTLWYHDHGVHHTAENVYSGLLAQYQLRDGSEDVLQLPQNAYDVEMIVHDMMFNSNGTQLFSLDNDAGMWGDVIMVNGTPWPYLNVEPRKYRFRFLVGDVSRSYRFSLSSGGPMWVIAGDGGLGPYAQKVTSWRHGMAERYDVVIDFAAYAGKTIQLRNTSPDKNVDYVNVDKVCEFRVGRRVTSTAGNMPYLDTAAARNLTPDVYSTAIPMAKALPAANFPASNAVMDLSETDAVNFGQAPRRLVLERAHGQWTINGTTWQQVIDSNFSQVVANPVHGTAEIWELANESGGWFHPLHIHLTDFKVLSRNGQPPASYEATPKDVVYLGPNDHALRGPRPLHGALPQPGARGPRHDVAVRRRP
jgi:spore coat protein A, manganese oxidase